MTVVFTFWPKAEYQSIALTSMGATHRLVSYYYARQLGRGFLERYAADGVVVDDETEALAAILRPTGGEDGP